jgi:adenylate kinase family enzyme
MHQRICIIGNAGSGKSTLAKVLGETLKIPVYHLDRHLLTSSFEKLERTEYNRVHADLISGEDWVIDGNYKKNIPERISRATLVIFLDISRLVTLPRVAKRFRKGGHMLEAIPEGAEPDVLGWEFLRWTATYSRRERIRNLEKLCLEAHVPFLGLKRGSTQKQVKLVLKALGKG